MGDLWRRIGTPDAITWVTVVVYYPAALLSTLFGSGVPREPNLCLLILTSTLASSTALVWLGLARLLIFGFRPGAIPQSYHGDPEHVPGLPSRPALVLSSFAVAVLIRAGMTDWLLIEFGLAGESHLAYRVVTSIPSTSFVLVALAIIVSLGRDYSRNLAELRRTQREFGELVRSHRGLIEAERARIVEFARRDLEERLRGLSSSAAPDALVRVRAAIEELVRPLSRRLAEADPTSLSVPLPAVPRPGWSATLRSLFAENPIQPLWFTVWLTLSSLFVVPFIWGPREGIFYTVLTAIVTAAVYGAGALGWKSLVRGLPWAAQAVYFSAVAVTTGATIALLGAFFSPAIPTEGPLLAPVLAALLLLGSWMFAALLALRRRTAALIERRREAERHLHRERVRLHSLYRAEMRSLARVLHGSVQDALSVAAFRIRAAIDANETLERFAELLVEVERSVGEAAGHIETVDRQADSAESVLGQIAELWEGLAKVRWRLSAAAREALATNTATRLSFNELVREACSNAVRHGEATRIDIFAHETGGELVLTVRNVGTPVREDIATGLGTRLLEELTLAWLREPTADGTVLTARLLLVD